jgi:phosphoadenosine phosphosulfate reductase
MPAALSGSLSATLSTSLSASLSGASTAIELNARASRDFEAKLAATRSQLQQAAADYAAVGAGAAQITQANSLGAEDMVISHLINSLQLDIGIFVLETGQLHPETLALLEDFRANSRAPLEVFRPVAEVAIQFVAREGKDAMYQSIALRKACCGIRKMEPLERAMAGKKAWITGLRREQSGARADVPLIDRTDVNRIKYNPLADWTWGDVWHYISLHQVAYNPLHDRFFPSIGCAPCTRAIALGEDFRAGRWWWEAELEGGAAKECGLHAQDALPVAQSILKSNPKALA